MSWEVEKQELGCSSAGRERQQRDWGWGFDARCRRCPKPFLRNRSRFLQEKGLWRQNHPRGLRPKQEEIEYVESERGWWKGERGLKGMKGRWWDWRRRRMNGFEVKRREEEERKRRSRDEKWWPWKKQKKIEGSVRVLLHCYTVSSQLYVTCMWGPVVGFLRIRCKIFPFANSFFSYHPP